MRDLDFVNHLKWFSPGEFPFLLNGFSYGFQREEPHETFHLLQRHTPDIVKVNGSEDIGELSETVGDGLWTDKKNVTLSVKTADCVPILLINDREGVCAALHAGWRGLHNGIVRSFGVAMQNERVSLEGFHAMLGPSISGQVYEVGKELVDTLQTDLDLRPVEWALCLSRREKWYLDCGMLAIIQLIHQGLHPEFIAPCQTCTFKSDDWSSYRREGKKAGRNWSWVRSAGPD